MTDAALLVDRFVSASSATDAHDSLQALLEALSSREEETRLDPELIWQDDALLEALLDVLVTASYKQVPLEEGPSLVCRIYQQLWKADGAANVLPKHPSPGRLVTSLLDVVCDTNLTDYTRVLGLQVLNDVCTKAPSSAQTQLLEIPNGLHRLADIFQEDNDQVRNELLGGVSQKIARWPSCAKIWVFSEVCDTLLQITMQEGGLTRGSVLVRDCLLLVESLVDPTLADLLWQSPIVAPKLAALLDLRGGTEFLNPPKPSVSQTDDLDVILATGSQKKETVQILPTLTYNEEDVVLKVLSILGILLDSPTARPQVWKQHAPLCSLVWELALVSRPPPNTKPVCALPSARLQQVALETVGEYFHDPTTMKQHYGLDRLLYLVCTGGITSKWQETLGLSQAALYVLCQTLPPDEAREMLTRSLAPPIMAHDGDEHKPPAPTVVQKLLNTVFENMNGENKLERRRINLLGALGALALFVNSPTDREVLLGITSSSSFVDAILQCLEEQDDEIIQLALLRFACEWVVEAPAVVQAFLASSHSIVLSVKLGSAKGTSVGTMVGYLLGLSLEYMPNGSDEKHGGWTKQSIMELLSKRKGGISGYTTDLEALKTADLPWKACALEWQRFVQWYSAEVLAIRRCVVKELTSGGDADEGDDDDDGNAVSSSSTSTKSLNRLVSQQAKELEEMRESLNEAKATIESQEGQLSVWKRRVESNPTQLDDLLTEYTNKTAEMEKEITTLKKQLQDKDQSVKTQLQERDNQIVQLQTSVQEWEDRERETRQERDDLRGELHGLSSAYNTLEQEYNRRDGPSMQGIPTGEASDARPGQQPEGEVSHQEQSSSPELATLRAENARLRSDAQAADEWMAMAVQRMNDIGGQNQALQEEVETLRGQLLQAQLTGGFVAPVVTGITQDQLDEERERRAQVEQRLDEARTTNSRLETEIRRAENSAQAFAAGIVEDLKQRLADQESQRQELEKKLENAKNDASTAMDLLGGSKSEKERLERVVASMEAELQKAHSEISAQSADVDAAIDENNTLIMSKDSELQSMRSLLASKDEELVGLRQQMTELRESVDSGLDNRNQELSSLRENVGKLSDELERTRKEVEETSSRERKEIQKRDERIRELETVAMQTQQQSRDLPSDVAGFFGSGADSEEEIKSLREANEAAQKWMAMAVEHHQMLSEQVSALTEDKAVLTKEIKEMRQQSVSATVPSAVDSSLETIKRLERDLSDRATEVTDLGARIIKLESEVRIKETEMAAVQEKISLCEQLQKQVDVLEDARDTELEKTRSLEDSISRVMAQKEGLAAQLDTLRHELHVKEELIAASVNKPSDEIESLTVLLEERDRETEKLREELEEAKRASSDAGQLRIALQNATDESMRLQADLDDAQSHVTSLKDKTALFEQLQIELQTLRDESSDVERLRAEVESVAVERDGLKESVSTLEAQLSDFQVWADAAQLKITELQNDNAALEKEMKNAAESVIGTDDAAVDGPADSGLSSLIMERDKLKESVTTLESQLSEFKSWADAAQLKINELQNEKEALEQGMKIPKDSDENAANSDMGVLRDEVASVKLELASVTAERDILKDTVSEMETQLSEFQSWTDAAQLKITELQDEKDACEEKVNELLESEKAARALLFSIHEEMEAKSTELSNAFAENEKLKAATKLMESGIETVDQLRDEIASSAQQLTSLMAERDCLKETVSEMETQLSELQSWSDAAKLKISELQEEKDAGEEKVNELLESEKGARALLDSIREEMEEKSTELSSALAENVELKAATKLMGSNSEIVDRLRDEIVSFELQLSSLTAERDATKEVVSEMETQLSEFQSWSDAARLKITELQDDKNALEKEIQVLAESEREARALLDSIRVEMEVKSNELYTAFTEIDELKAAKAIAFEKNSSLEHDMKVLEAQCSDLVERAGKAETLLTQREESLRAAEESAATLLSALETIQDQSADVIDEWKAQVEALESTVAELEAALQQQQVEASGAVEQWSARWTELDSLRSELEVNLETVSNERDELVEMLQHEKENGGKEVLAQIERERSAERAEWGAERERLQARIDEQSESLVLSSQNVQAANEELSQMRTSAAETVDAWKNRVKEMEGTIEELEEAISQRRDEAADAIAQWETHCSMMEERAEELERELEAMAQDKDDLQVNMEKSIEPLAEQLEDERAARRRLENEKETAIQQIETIKVQSEDIVNQWKGKVQELETAVSELEEQLEVQQEEATKAISQWEATCGALEQKVMQLDVDIVASISALRSELESRQATAMKVASELGRDVRTIELVQESPMDDNPSKAIASLQAKLKESNELLSNAVESLIVERASRKLDQPLGEELHQHQEEILALKEQIEVLQQEIVDLAASQERLRELEIALEAEKENLKATEASLETKRDLTETLEAEVLHLRQQMENNSTETQAALALERTAREAAERHLHKLQEMVSETEEAFMNLASKEEQIFSESSQTKEDSARMQQQLRTRECEWQNEREILIQERDDLRAAVGELQEELRDASDALQACVTDEISDKATELASQALRYQMEQLRSQVANSLEACGRERNARSVAEKEVEALRRDLANVLGVIDGDSDASNRVQRMTMRASEAMQRREFEEIDSIRKALERALQELESARSAERKAAEAAAASRIQLSVCEQEVFAAKSDLAFLTQTLEETREAEASKAASLEYRISSLEDDREVLRQFHQDELENLRNELTHVSMEKDRIMHSLKESEKKNVALVFSTSKKRESDGSATPEAELSRLRVEKAQLLTAAAEEGSRTERRIREAVAAHVSSMEADIILERELRVAAEAIVEDIKFQMEELKSEAVGNESGNVSSSHTESFLDELSAELKQFKEETRSLSAENAALRRELEEANENSQAEIIELTEKYRKAQAKAHMLANSDNFDAEVNVEVAKLRSNGGGSEGPRNWIVVRDNPVQDENDAPGFSPVDAFDMIQQQKIAIQEERAMYLELLAEHDDLLALLAQQDLEKASLNVALARVAGPEAVSAAMRNAEETAVKRFGKYVKLTS